MCLKRSDLKIIWIGIDTRVCIQWPSIGNNVTLTQALISPNSFDSKYHRQS